jgi:genome maintenance exonuclease 1
MSKIIRIDTKNGRYYQINPNIILPSVTNILSKTKDRSGLDAWRERVGEEEANRIGKAAAGRGTMMHKLLEIYLNHLHIKDEKERLKLMFELTNIDEEILPLDQNMKKQGIQLFNQIYKSSGYIDNIQTVKFQEVFLWMDKFPFSFAGTVDNASYLKDGKFKIIDFKTSSKPKQEYWISDYKMQVSAYSIAIWDRYGIKPDGAEIWISAETGGVQKFVLTYKDIRKYFLQFKKRLELFYKMYPNLEIYN